MRSIERRVRQRRTSDVPRPPAGRGGVLSRRESEVASLVARGRSNREIAVALVICEDTVKKHVSHALAKLGLHNRTELALAAAEQTSADHS